MYKPAKKKYQHNKYEDFFYRFSTSCMQFYYNLLNTCLIWTQAAMEPSMPGHAPHNVPGRSAWGGLNVAYEMQQDPNKPG